MKSEVNSLKQPVAFVPLLLLCATVLPIAHGSIAASRTVALQSFQRTRPNTCKTSQQLICLNVLESIRGGSNNPNYGNGGGYYDYRDDANNEDDYYSRPSSRGSYDYSGRDDPYYHEQGEEGDRYEEDERYGSQRYEDDDRGYQDDYYQQPNEYGRSSASRKSASKKKSSSSFLPSNVNLPGMLPAANRKVGFSCLGSGMAITLLGISLFFNKALLRLGNILFLIGIPLTIGPARTMAYFFQPKKVRATGCLAGGIFLVLAGHPVFGMALEVFGLLNLFGNMFPLLMMFLRSLPVVGDLIPEKKKATKSSRNSNSSGGNRDRQRRYDDYYGDDGNDNPERYY